MNYLSEDDRVRIIQAIDSGDSSIKNISIALAVHPLDVLNVMMAHRPSVRPRMTDHEYRTLRDHKKGKRFFSDFDIEVLAKYGIEIFNAVSFERMRSKLEQAYKENPNLPVNEYCKLFPDLRQSEIRRFIASQREIKEYDGKVRIVTHDVATNARRKAVVQEFLNNPKASKHTLAKKFGVLAETISQDLRVMSEEYKKTRLENYELYRKKLSDGINMVMELCLERHNRPGNSSSRWLEIYLQAIEKESKLHGLNRPEQRNINVETTIKTKEERDAVVDAYFTTVEPQAPSRLDAPQALLDVYDDSDATNIQ